MFKGNCTDVLLVICDAILLPLIFSRNQHSESSESYLGDFGCASADPWSPGPALGLGSRITFVLYLDEQIGAQRGQRICPQT